MEKVQNEKFAIIVISKSGTTLEPALAFRLLRKTLEKKMGVAASRKNIVAITDYEKGTLHDLAKKNHYVTFGIRNDIGGRFSTLTPVGMFIMMVKGIDTLMVLKGAKQALNDTSSSTLDNNSAFLYACYRHYLHTVKQMNIESFIVYEPSLTFVGEM
jgi:glucose-6-phosphate isomerase